MRSKFLVILPNRADSAALQAAIDLARQSERAAELVELIRERGWEAAAEICAYDLQSRSLELAHWSDEVPCAAPVRGKSRASRLLRRMLKRGISRWHPDPLAAIAEAGPPARDKYTCHGQQA